MKLSEKDTIKAGISDLPAWVFFPDYERVEWINRILDQMWQPVGHYVSNVLSTTVSGWLRVLPDPESYTSKPKYIVYMPESGAFSCWDLRFFVSTLPINYCFSIPWLIKSLLL